MAKRKAARASSQKGAAKGRGGNRARAAAKKTASARTARKAARKPGRRVAAKARKAVRRPKAVARKAKKTAPARKPVRASRKASPARKAPAKKAVTKSAAKPAAKPVRITSAPPARRAAPAKVRQPARTAPGLNRERRTIIDDDIVQSPPSSLDMNRTASSARSGRRELLERYAEHTETSPDLTGGDVDADWESAYSVGDEAPGGDNPTPDQDIVDDIGKAMGVQYQDNEELKGEKKIAQRDKHRWELDPASSDDWEDR